MNALGEILGDSPAIRRLREQLEHLLERASMAPRPPAILLSGETGTGKGLVARSLHRAGPRARTPFVDVNCAAIPDTLLEAELFGYERGAFTDARQAKPGLFQLAHRGTLFLDEIGTLSPALQAKLLKAIEDGVVRRLGSTRAEPVDVWIISATNEDLAEALRARRFREDLYHRLAVLSLPLPPLRERGGDVLMLAEQFLARACADYGRPPRTFARDARAALCAYGWPGNVRELANVVERVALLADESLITAAMLALPPTPPVDDPPGTESGSATPPSRDQMCAQLLEALTETGWNISQTAARLGVARNTVLARITRFGLTASAGVGAAPRPGGAPRRDAPLPVRANVPAAHVATARLAWEPRRLTLLRVDVLVAAGTSDASRALEDMIGKAETFGGEIVELAPSAFVAAFGLEAVEDAPVRAALAALAISKVTERARSAGERQRAKIVIHVAQVLVTQLRGAPTIDLEGKRAACMAIDALAALDLLDTIVVSEAAAPFLERRFELTPATTIESSASSFHRLTGRERTGFGLGGRPLSRFVGRDGELRFVTSRMASAARGHGQVIGIVGEPGVGKSRFVYELARTDATQGWRVLGCRAVSHGSTTPLLTVGDLLRRYFSIEDADGLELIRAKVTETIASRHDELNASLAPLLSLLDIPVEDVSWIDLDPHQQRQRIQEAVKRLLLRESRIQPLLLIVEDLQWVDAGTQALLDALVESLPTARLLLLVNHRPEYQHRWAGKTCYSQLRLDTLLPENAGQLLRTLLGNAPELEPLERLLVKRGNPFFIEESIRALVETGALIGELGGYRLSRPIQTLEVPATVQAILAARIERLVAEDKQLLQTASVIGKDVPVALLHAVADAGEDDVQRGLARLRAAEFLYETRHSPDAEYSFKHALTHEIAYGTLFPDRRRALHARIVRAIEHAHPDRLAEHVERLAHHAVRGELWEQAVVYLRQAGAKALTRSAHRESVSYFEQALVALGHLPETRDTLAQAIDLRCDLTTSLFPLGAFERILGYLHEAERLAGALDDRWRRAWLSVQMCRTLRHTGHLSEAHTFGRNAHVLAESLGDVPLRVTGNLYLGIVCLGTGAHRQAENLFLKVLRLLERERSRERFGLTAFPAVVARAELTSICADLGRFEEGITHGHEGIRLAEALDHPYSLATVSWYLALLYMTRGDLGHSVPLLQRGLALAREWNLTYFSLANTGSLGYAHALSGRTAKGIPLLEHAVGAFEAMGDRAAQLRFQVTLSEAYLLADRREDALALARRILALARVCGHRRRETEALRLLGDVIARRDPPEDAERHYRDALALAGELEMRPLVAHCHAGLGRLLERMGKRREAREHLAAATAMYCEMGMPFWIERAEAARAGRDGWEKVRG